MRNRERNQGRKARGRGLKARQLAVARRSKRRGVLLLVVLSMLVLFMLVGTAFLMSSNQTRVAMKAAAKEDRLGNYATQLLDRALLQLVRDTGNPYSVIRYHSLLGDLYGTDGFQGVIYPADLTNGETGYLTRFAGALAGTPAQQLGPTNGQFIDIYVSVKPYKAIDYSTSYVPVASTNPANNTALELRNVLKLDRNPYGQPQPYPLPLTKGYFNGCLLTITSGPATGQSARILDYEYAGDAAVATTPATRIFRFRVMSFQRDDGQPLQIDQTTGTKGRMPELKDLVLDEKHGQTFMVNGRAFSGTGVGYNPLATTGQPRLSALQLFPIPGGSYIGAELALLPNSVYFNPLDPILPIGAAPPTSTFDPFTTPIPLNDFQSLNIFPSGTFLGKFLYPSFPGPGGTNEGYDASDFQNIGLALQTVTPRSQGRLIRSVGGDSTKPLITLEASDPEILNQSKMKDFLRLDVEDVPMPSFHRPDLANFWYHRLGRFLTSKPTPLKPADAVRGIIHPYDDDALQPLWSVNPHAKGLTAADAALISAIKRQISLRPTREDHPHFDGSNTDSISIPATHPKDLKDFKDEELVVNSNISIPMWDVIGGWDIDNDNDGVRDSIWVDLGDSIQQTEDGRRYKPLYAILCVDLDSRLNVNAHGLADDILPPLRDTTKAAFFDPTYDATKTQNWTGNPPPQVGNLTHTWPVNFTAPIGSTLQLARGIGYGPAEISLRPVFPAPLNTSLQPVYGNRSEAAGPVDSYATLLSGRLSTDGKAFNGRYGFDTNINFTLKGQASTAGTNYRYDPIVPAEPASSPRRYTGEQATPNVAAQMKFFDYPFASTQSSALSFPPALPLTYPLTYLPISAFGTSPDLKARYALGLDYMGQPVYEVANDVNPNTAALTADKWLRFNLLANSPYELDLSSPQRRDSWASRMNSFGTMAAPGTAFTSTIDRSFSRIYDPASPTGLNDDAAFSPTDLEKVLRGGDADSGTLPSRLWDVVNGFDPIKLYDPNKPLNLQSGDPYRVQDVSQAVFGSTNKPEMLATAQQIAGINRRLVTTESFDLPVVNQTMPEYVSEFGADGVPGRRNDPAHSTFNYVNGTEVTDDFKVIMGIERSRAKITDFLYYRTWLEARKLVMRTLGLTETGPSNSLDALSWANYQNFMVQVKARTDAAFARLPSDLLAPELIAGNRMDLNRPFGDGKDNNNNGVVDDPLEAGEPFVDRNGNGKYDIGEPYIDFDGSKDYTRPVDQLWESLTTNGTLGEKISFDYSNGQVVPVYKNYIAGGVRNLESQGRQLYARQLYCLMLLLTDENYIAPWDPNDAQLMTWMNTTRAPIQAELKANYVAAGMPAAEADKIAIAEADLIVKRKYTCKTIAQWAINCVDMRDSDVIQTPFEYDENPWDGWGVPDQDGNNIPIDGDLATNENLGEMIEWFPPPQKPGVPVGRDGIPGNDDDNSKVIAPSPKTATLPEVLSRVPIDPIDKRPTPLNQTRGEVWGAERPELLISETLAFHDRRTEDLESPMPQGHGAISSFGHYQPGQRYDDIDPDQRLRPRGSLFVEVYNPWSPNGQHPAELYTSIDTTKGTIRDRNHDNKIDANDMVGVELGRLSNFALDDDTLRLSNAPTKVSTTSSIKRSPVWRMIVVEEWPDSRNADPIDDVRPDKLDPGRSTISATTGQIVDANAGKKYTFPGPKESLPYKAIATTVKNWSPSAVDPNPPFRPTDPDFDPLFGGDILQVVTTLPADPTSKLRTTYMVSSAFKGKLGKQVGSTTNANQPDPSGTPKNQFYVQYPSIEREFYFTTDKSPAFDPVDSDYDQLKKYDYSATRFRLRIPDRSIYLRYKSGWDKPKPGQTQKFIPWQLELSPTDPADSAIAPIMPGSYGMIGSAGTNYHYDKANPSDPKSQVYTTAIGRLSKTGGTGTINTDDGDHYPFKTRRIELRPSNDPTKPQLLVTANGGDPNDALHPPQRVKDALGNEVVIQTFDPTTPFIGRDNELINKNGTIDNITVPIPDTDPDPAKRGKPKYYQPCVAIPVEGMNISEPAWGYAAREAEAVTEEKTGGITSPLKVFANAHNQYEGFYGTKESAEGSYDKPLDGYSQNPISLELMRTGTTANYRTIHLQRLANPLLPWNPEPKLANGDLNPEFRANLPINPYRTFDSASANLTAFNGVSGVEGTYPDNRPNNPTLPTRILEEQKQLLQKRPWEGLEQKDYGNKFDEGNQVWYFRSTERGAWARLNVLKPATSQASPQQRVLWAQEPAMVKLKNPAGNMIFDLIPKRKWTMAFSEIPNQLPNDIKTSQGISPNRMDMVMEHTLGFGNESYGKLFIKPDPAAPSPNDAPVTTAIGAPAPGYFTWDHDVSDDKVDDPPTPVNSTNPWLEWDNRPYVSAEELLNVPMASQAQMLRQYSTIDPSVPAKDRVNPYGLAQLGTRPNLPAPVPPPPITYPAVPNVTRWKVMQAPFGQLPNVFAASAQPADVVRDTDWIQTEDTKPQEFPLPSGYVKRGVPVRFTKDAVDKNKQPIPDGTPIIPEDATIAGDVRPYGAPNFNRILEYVQVPSRYVGTDTMLNAETFNNDATKTNSSLEPFEDIIPPTASYVDSRYYFQPPFNKVSRERDPGRVNLNTVTSRRAVVAGVPQIWSEVFDGIMHRIHDGNPSEQLSHLGPAWRDVVLSRRGYIDPSTPIPLSTVASPAVPPLTTTDRTSDNIYPDVASSLLRPDFPTMFSNPFRSPDAGDLVPLSNMMQVGVQVTLLRSHPYAPADPDSNTTGAGWGQDASDDNGNGIVDDAREAGIRPSGKDPVTLLPYANDELMVGKSSHIPLFAESTSTPFADGNRNPYMMYEPMSRLGNLVTNRSGVYAVWITVGYFEVEKAPDWNDPDSTIQLNVRAHFGGDINLYNRAYPDGYMLGKELGSETGDVKRPRGFYIIDRTEEVGFKPGEDLNVEKTIRLRRRIE